MWEDSAVAQGRWSPKSIPYRYYRSQENKLIKQADEVIVIGQNLMNEVVGHLRVDTPKMIPNKSVETWLLIRWISNTPLLKA